MLYYCIAKKTKKITSKKLSLYSALNFRDYFNIFLFYMCAFIIDIYRFIVVDWLAGILFFYIQQQ